MPLTDTAIRNAQPREKPYKLYDERGLLLLVTPTGGKWWRFKFRFRGKEQQLSFGTYPDVKLKEARDKREEARKQLSAHRNPSYIRSTEKLARSGSNSLEGVAREWLHKYKSGRAESTVDQVTRRLERDVFPWLGCRPVAEITAPELLTVLQRIEQRGTLETAHRVLHHCGQVWRYAIRTGRAQHNITSDLRGALAQVKAKHHSAITDSRAIGPLLRAIDGYQGLFVTRCALRLAPLVFVRPAELRKAEWSEFDVDAGEWNIPAARMKMKQPHLVPLASQAAAILRELQPLTGPDGYVFPGARTNSRPMSENTINAALRRLGYGKDDICGHGFRAMARTILDEVLNVRPDFIEHQLAHKVRDPNGRAYNRTKFLRERREMMQRWADYLDELAAGAKPVPQRAAFSGPPVPVSYA